MISISVGNIFIEMNIDMFLRKVFPKINSHIVRIKNYLFPNPEQFTVENFVAREGWENFKDDYVILAESLDRHLSFQTMMDIGCANGFLMDPLVERGYDVKGVEVSSDVMRVLPDRLAERVHIGDFSIVSGSYDLVCCVEVAEHIEPNRSRELVDTLTKAANSFILFSAAPPGQTGHGHINCRPHTQWISWFKDRSWVVDEERTRLVKADLKKLRRAHYLRDNSFILCESR